HQAAKHLGPELDLLHVLAHPLNGVMQPARNPFSCRLDGRHRVLHSQRSGHSLIRGKSLRPADVPGTRHWGENRPVAWHGTFADVAQHPCWIWPPPTVKTSACPAM